MDTNPTHNSSPISFSGALVLSKVIHNLVLICPPPIQRMKEASKAVINSSYLHTVPIVLVPLTPMRMDDALKFPFLCLQSISRTLSASVSLIMGKVKISNKSISGHNLPSDRYKPPTLTDRGSSWEGKNNPPPWIAWHQPLKHAEFYNSQVHYK